MSDSVATVPEATLAVDEQRHGWRVQRIEAVPDLRATAYLVEHDTSGARLLHLHADDSENLFAIGLRTPPEDDNGIAHILEHTVLCGSERFPVKDPFVELLKSSLASFLNAMTYPDRTVYPCASLNRRDFFNLASVYCDAVFHPLLREEHFKQEGHRLGFATTGDPDSELLTKGIVYNEMKGAYSDFNGALFRASKTGIAPDTCYGYDSGGRPDAIPTLSYQAFCDFHRTLYHPSNAFIFVYGDIPTAEHLAFLDERLAGFQRIDPHTTVEQQPRWSEPRREAVRYPIGADEDLTEKTALSMTWLCCPITDTDDWLAMEVLGLYLLDNDASPLRRALIASGLGHGLTPAGYADYMHETYFLVGLKGTEADRAEQIERVIRDCLAEQAEGLDAERLDAAFHQLQLELDDIPDQFPLQLMGRAYQRWLYGEDPLAALDIGPRLQALRERARQDPGVLAAVLRRWLVDNPHCLIQTYRPDPEWNERAAQEERERMQQRRNALSDAELAAIAREDVELEAKQNAPNPPEAIATLPKLARSDVPERGVEPPVEQQAIGDATLLRTDLLHGGVTHLELAIDIAELDDDLIPWLPLYGAALRKMDAGGERWERLAERQAAVSSGLGVATDCGPPVAGPEQAQFHLGLGCSALHQNVPAMLELIGTRLSGLELDDRERLAEIVRERLASLRNGVIPGGSSYASRHAARHLSRSGRINERKGGFEQIRFFESLGKQLDDRLDEAVERLAAIRDAVAQRGRVTASVIGDDAATAALADFLQRFAERPASAPLDNEPVVPEPPPWEGVATAADVAYVARVARLPQLDDAESAALGMLATQMRVGYLWDKIRVQGGAYGARCSWSRSASQFSVASYRDPHIAQTIAAYDGIASYVAEDMDLSEAGLEQAIIGTFKGIDRPLRPGSVVGQTLDRHLSGDSAQRRQQRREALLGLDAATVRRVVADVLGPALRAAPLCVLSSRGKLEAAHEAGLVRELAISEL